MSGLLGQIIGSVMGGQGGTQGAAIAGVIQQVLVGGGQSSGAAGSGGGLAALLTRFEAAGFGQQAQSWVSTGENQPVSSDNISRVFSGQELETWASQAGTSVEKIKEVLAQALPQAVDHATPGGQMPTEVTDLSGVLAKLLGGLGGARLA